MDPGQYPESAEKYGLWDVPKTYLHMYPEGQIEMDWDQPLERFDGMTAYEVTKFIGFPAHVSQYWDFAWYTAGFETSKEVPKCGPREYGLFRTTVGEDVEKNDFFENVTSHKVLLEEEARQEAERQEQERLEQERLEQERREAEAIAESQEQAMKEQQALAQEQARQEEAARTRTRLLIGSGVAVIVLVFLVIYLVIRRNRGKKK